MEKALKNSLSENTPIQTPIEEKTEDSFSPMLHGKATDALALVDRKEAVVNPLNGTIKLVSGGVKTTVNNFNDLALIFTTSTHKLLCRGITEFTKNNHIGTKDREIRSLQIEIPLKDFALKCGYDVIEHETDTPEEAAKEKKRAENELKDCRKKVRKDLATLKQSTLSWSEKVRGKEEDFLDIGIIGSKGIRNGYIYMSFTPEWGDYLIQLPLTQFMDSLYSIDERNPHAYPMGLLMTEHFNMDSNQKRGTAQLLKVSTLLSYTKLPSIDDPTVKKHGWQERIKEPFERALDVLTSSGVLEDWYYSHSKGEELTDEEADFKNFKDWTDTLIHFTLKDAPDPTPRLEAKEAEREERAKSQKKKAAKKKNS